MSTEGPEAPGGRHLAFEAGVDEAGSRLDVLLGRLPEVGSRSRASALLEAGAVTVDGAVRQKSYRLVPGQLVEFTILEDQPVREPVPEDIPISIAYEDQWLLIPDKPAGMVVHPSRGHVSGTLVNALLRHGLAGGDAYRPGVVHRLDRDTSGLLLVAKNADVHRRLTRMLAERRIDRRYLALVHGGIAAPGGSIEAPIGRDPVRRKNMAVRAAGGKEAVTHFEVLERMGDFTLVEVRLQTGRTHQIRVHFLAIGHPVVGDPTYGRHDVLGLGRQFLHSHRLSLTHPVTEKLLAVTSPLPPELSAALDLARARSLGRRSRG